MNQDWGVKVPQYIKEGSPDPVLVTGFISPQAVLEKCSPIRDSHTDEVIETTIRQTLDIKIDWRSTECQFRRPNNVNLSVSNCQGFKSMVIFFSARGLMLGSAAWAKCVGELSDR